MKTELIRAAGERATAGATDALIAAGSDPDLKIRRESLRALWNVATPGKAPALIAMLTKAGDDERQDAEHALSAAIRRAEQPDVKPVLAAYRSVSDPETKSSFLTVLASTSDKDALPILREALQSGDSGLQRAAIVGLSEWATPDPAEDLLEVARTSGSESLKVLGLRGYIKLVQIPAGRAPSETAKLLGTAMRIAVRPEEKKAVLAAVQRVPAPESLQIARAAASDPAIAAEAKVAITTLERTLAARTE